MRSYKCLPDSIVSSGDFRIEPIRDEDKFAIMQIRNEQLYHLRQAEPLTIDQQERYFATVVASLFEQEKPSQLLFSFFEKEEFIGYGGLVHINWVDRNAEISFVMKTALEQDFFSFYWSNYLQLIEKLAFESLAFHKIFTYAFDLRPHLYEVLLSCDFREEARLKEHCKFEGRYLDVLIHSKINEQLSFVKPSISDVALYYDWTNDAAVRANSFQSEGIPYENHVAWFTSKLKDENCFMYLFEDHDRNKVGQVRIQKDAQLAIIGVSADSKYRGRGFASKMIAQASDAFLATHSGVTIHAYIKSENKASVKAFEKAGFELQEELMYSGFESLLYIKK